MSAEKLPTKII